MRQKEEKRNRGSFLILPTSPQGGSRAEKRDSSQRDVGRKPRVLPSGWCASAKMGADPHTQGGFRAVKRRGRKGTFGGGTIGRLGGGAVSPAHRAGNGKRKLCMGGRGGEFTWPRHGKTGSMRSASDSTSTRCAKGEDSSTTAEGDAVAAARATMKNETLSEKKGKKERSRRKRTATAQENTRLQ